MAPTRTILILLLASVAVAQQPSVADVARAKQQKSGETKKAKRVYTDEDIPSRPKESAATSMKPAEKTEAPEPKEAKAETDSKPDKAEGEKLSADEIKALRTEIVELKSQIADMEAEQAELSKDADQKAQILKNARGSGLCNAQKTTYQPTSTCEVIEEEQRRLAEIKRDLPEAKAKLKAIQDRLRNMGYGGAIFDP